MPRPTSPSACSLLPGGHHRSLQHDLELQAVSRRFVRDAAAGPAARTENRFSFRLRAVPSPVDLVELPFLREALAELVLLALAGGLVGAWIVLRRLAFYSHAVGSATFPGLVTADAAAPQPHAARARRGARIRGRRGERAPDRRAIRRRPPRCCWWPRSPSAWSWPATCSSPGPAWTGCCSARCSASTARTSPSPPCARRVALAATARARPRLDRHRVRPRRRAWPRPPPGLARTWRCSRSWRSPRWRPSPRWGRCSWARCSCFPPRPRGCSPAACPGSSPGRSALALAEGGAGLYLAYWLDAPPGPPIAVLGAVVYGALALAAAADRPGARGRDGVSAPRVAVEGLAAGYGGPPALRDVSFAAAAGQSVCVLGPNGGGKTTLFRALLGELRPDAGSLRVSGRPAYLAQTERTRLDFPVSALDVALMGTLAAGRWWRPPGRGDARAAAGGARPRGPGGQGARRRSASCRAASAAARCSPGRSCRTPQVLLLDEPLAGVDPASAELIASRVRRAARRGPHAARVHPRRGERPRVRPRALPERPPGGVRPARRRARRARRSRPPTAAS